MLAEYTRDAVATAAVFGFFASSWFGWAQESPSAAWRKPLIAGAILSLLVSVAGAALTWQYWSTGTTFNPSTGRSFGVIVGIEFAVAGLGAGALGRTAIKLLPWELVHLFGFALSSDLTQFSPLQRVGLIVANLLIVVYLAIMVATGGRRSLHDLVAGTVVRHHQADAEEGTTVSSAGNSGRL